VIRTFADKETQEVFNNGKSKRLAIPNKMKREIAPTHPGEMIREDYLPDYGLTTASLADALERKAVRHSRNGVAVVSSVRGLPGVLAQSAKRAGPLGTGTK
jgi:hypothetical protein